jgi:hypothetical protein
VYERLLFSQVLPLLEFTATSVVGNKQPDKIVAVYLQLDGRNRSVNSTHKSNSYAGNDQEMRLNR